MSAVSSATDEGLRLPVFVEWLGPDENIVTKLELSGRSKTLATLTRHQHYFSEDSETVRVARSEAEPMAPVKSAKTKTGPSKTLPPPPSRYDVEDFLNGPNGSRSSGFAGKWYRMQVIRLKGTRPTTLSSPHISQP